MFVELYNFQSIFSLIFHLTIPRNFSVVVGIRAQCSALWHIDGNQEMSGKWMTRIWHPDVSCNPLLIHGVVIISGSFFLMELIFCSSPFHLSCHSIWSYSSVSMFSIFLCLLFFINTWDFSFHIYFFWQCTFFSYFSSCHPFSYCLNYELPIQSLSVTFSDCFFLVLLICILLKRPHCLLKDDWIFQGISFLWTSPFRKRTWLMLNWGLPKLKKKRTCIFSFVWLLLSSILPSFSNDRKTLLTSFQLGQTPSEVRIAAVFIRTGQGLNCREGFWGCMLKEHSWI